jgi:hypothetical protein
MQKSQATASQTKYLATIFKNLPTSALRSTVALISRSNAVVFSARLFFRPHSRKSS